MSVIENYKTGSDITCMEENLNTLIVFDEYIAQNFPVMHVDMHLVGGSAFLLKNFGTRFTYDIDMVNRLSAQLKEVAESLGISDNASDVVVLPKYYEKRMTEFQYGFKHIRIFLLSDEDLLISKLGTSRIRDLKDARHSGILLRADIALVRQLINSSYTGDQKDKLLRDLHTVTSDTFGNCAETTAIF